MTFALICPPVERLRLCEDSSHHICHFEFYFGGRSAYRLVEDFGYDECVLCSVNMECPNGTSAGLAKRQPCHSSSVAFDDQLL